MRAILNNDLIVTLTMDATKGTEIGNLPKGVGMERLRFNGAEVVDLAGLSAFWVETIAGGFMLHAAQVPNSYYVEMAFEDRQYLYINGGAPSIKSQVQIDKDKREKKIKILKNKLRLKLSRTVGDFQDQNVQILAYIMMLIIYVRQQPQILEDFFDEIIPDIEDIFPLDRWEDILKDSFGDLKDGLEDYYEGIDTLE